VTRGAASGTAGFSSLPARISTATWCRQGVVLCQRALPSTTRSFHIPDSQAETTEYPEASDRAGHLGFRTILAVPLIRAGEAIGTISIRRTEVCPFTDPQINLAEDLRGHHSVPKSAAAGAQRHHADRGAAQPGRQCSFPFTARRR